MIHAHTEPESLARDQRPNAAAAVVAYGDGSITRLPSHAAAAGSRRILLVCGKRSFDASGAAAIVPSLERIADVVRWSDFRPNTDSADLRQGLQAMREFKPDLVLGVGGGSALDMAKLLVSFEDVDDADVLDQIRGGFKARERRPQLYLVPTTSGSGAEATHFAVVYIGNDKYSIGGDGMRPDAIALDPQLTLSGAAYQRATSGIDAVCQAIESMWAAGATDRSRHFARVALRMLTPAIEFFVNSPDAASARAMAIGSHFAGRAINISRTTAAHALSYGITKNHGLSHGHAAALTLGSFLDLHATRPDLPLSRGVHESSHDAAMGEIAGMLGVTDPAAAGQAFRVLMHNLGLSRSVPAGDITSSQLNDLAATVNVERLGNHPVILSQPDLAAVLRASFSNPRLDNQEHSS